MFHDTIKKAQADGRLTGACGQSKTPCWDCLRRAGLTPPYELRDKYPQLYPRTIMNGIRTWTQKAKKKGDPDVQVREAERGDPRGRPMPAGRIKQEKLNEQEAADKRHLRSAIANREVI